MSSHLFCKATVCGLYKGAPLHINQVPPRCAPKRPSLHQEWSEFAENVDDVMPLNTTCRQVVSCSQAKEGHESLQPEVLPSHQEGGSHDEKGPVLASGAAGPGSALQVARPSWAQGLTLAELRKAQLADTALGLAHGWLTNGTKPNCEAMSALSPYARAYWPNFKSLTFFEGTVHLVWVDPVRVNSEVKKLVVPQSVRPRVLNSCHDAIFATYLWVKKTVDKVTQEILSARDAWAAMSKGTLGSHSGVSVCRASGQDCCSEEPGRLAVPQLRKRRAGSAVRHDRRFVAGYSRREREFAYQLPWFN